jgi:uncharacterized repeat protein (TIGR01451 family)
VKNLFTFFLIFTSLHSSAQLNFNWVFTDSGATTGNIRSGVVLDNKNLVVIGTSDNGSDVDPGPATVSIASPFFLAGYSQQKSLVFARPFCYNGNLTGNLQQMIRDKSDNFYVSFIGQGPWDFDPAPGVGEFILPVMGQAIVKFDSVGNFKWAIPYDSSGTLVRWMTVQSDLSLLVLGEMQGATDLDPSTGTWMFSSPNTSNTFLAKYDSSGNFVTAKEFKTSGSYPNTCIPDQIVSTSSGDVFFNGSYAGTIDFDPGVGTNYLTATANGGSYGMNFLLKLNQNLDFEFVHEFYYGNDLNFDLNPGLNGDLILTGNCTIPVDLDFSPAVTTIDSQSQQCIFLAKYNSAGGLIWAKTLYTNYGNYSSMYIRGVQPDGAMDIYFSINDSILSNSFGFYDVLTPNNPYSYLYLSRLDSSGINIYNFLLNPPAGNLGALNFAFSDPTHFYFWGSFHQDTSDVCIGPGIYPISSVNFSQFFISHYSFDYELSMLRGNVYYDFNSNTTRDSLDFGAQNSIVEIQPGPVFISTDSRGDYSLYTSTGNYNITIPSLPPHIASTFPASHSATFTFPNQVDTVNDFALQLLPGDTDVKVVLTEYGNARPGNFVHYSITYSNPGTTMQTGSLSVSLDSQLTYVSSSVSPSTINGNTIEWNYISLLPFQAFNIDVLTSLSVAAADSDTLISTAVILPVISDLNPSDNYDTSKVIVTSSYDPNSKSVEPSGPIGLIDVVNGISLFYTIQFQNTGSDTAFNITLLDTLSENLDLSSLTIVASSHPCAFRLYPNRLMEFKFENVLLPDSTTNEAASHGFVTYQIKPKSSLLPGDFINNTAYIYFDYNEAVPTNIVQTEIQFMVNTSVAKEISFQVFPVPADNSIFIRSTLGQLPESYRITDISGKTIRFHHFSHDLQNVEIDVSALESAMYFLEIRDQLDYKSVYRFVVIHR